MKVLFLLVFPLIAFQSVFCPPPVKSSTQAPALTSTINSENNSSTSSYTQISRTETLRNEGVRVANTSQPISKSTQSTFSIYNF